MLIVGVDPVVVEADLMAGRLSCPGCGGGLRPWGRARRREMRARAGTRSIRPRRSRCAGCGVSHVLLPEDGLVRRRDVAVDIGDALAAKAAGWGHRPIAARLGVPATTVRGWLRRFGSMAERVRAHFTRWAVALDPMLGPVEPAGSVFADAVGSDRRGGRGGGASSGSAAGVACGVGADRRGSAFQHEPPLGGARLNVHSRL